MYNDKGVNSTRYNTIIINICMNPKIYEANIDRTEGRNSSLKTRVGYFNTSFSIMDRTIRQNINKEIEE